MIRALRFLRHKFNMVKNNPYVILTETNGKQYLTIVKTGLRGAVWRRRFEIVREIEEIPNPGTAD